MFQKYFLSLGDTKLYLLFTYLYEKFSFTPYISFYIFYIIFSQSTSQLTVTSFLSFLSSTRGNVLLSSCLQLLGSIDYYHHLLCLTCEAVLYHPKVFLHFCDVKGHIHTYFTVITKPLCKWSSSVQLFYCFLARNYFIMHTSADYGKPPW